ncbi:MAG: hypothetical protein JWN80_505 [Microbacteriaceae bacterium]|nr:hypothetical protein [Microbacteriaceae bacterium]
MAPSTELRLWFGHVPSRFAEFRERYVAELHNNTSVADFTANAGRHPVVSLVYGAKDELHNHAVVLAEYLRA